MTTYRDSHTAEGHGAHYDEVVYGEGRYDSAVWTLEQEILRGWISAYGKDGMRNYLDFACGTGRIMSIVAHHAKKVVGVDISNAMMKEARDRVPSAIFYEGDITQDKTVLDGEGPFDCITMFRFLLNAEDGLRKDALIALRDMVNDEGILICNNHGNASSLLRPVMCIRRLLGMSTQNMLSYGRVVNLFASCGWKVLEVRGVCYMPRFVSRVAPRSLWLWIERRLGALRGLSRFAIYQMFVLQKIKS